MNVQNVYNNKINKIIVSDVLNWTKCDFLLVPKAFLKTEKKFLEMLRQIFRMHLNKTC